MTKANRETMMGVTIFAYGVFVARHGVAPWIAGLASLWVIGFGLLTAYRIASDLYVSARRRYGPKVKVKIVHKRDD